MRRLVVVLTMALFLAGISAAGRAPAIVHGAAVHKQVCKTVMKKVHGKKKKVKVCATVKAAPKVTATSTPLPTATSAPTATATAVIAVQPAIDPNLFRLTTTDVPPTVTVMQSSVESDAQAASEPKLVHFGTLTWDQEGRLTGYYWFATVQPPAGFDSSHTTSVAYHVSIFSTGTQATAAWQQQRTGWIANDATGGSCGSPDLGAGTSCADTAVTANGALSELYFTRGRILLQVWAYESYNDFINNTNAIVVPNLAIARTIALVMDARASSAPGNGISTLNQVRSVQRDALTWSVRHAVRTLLPNASTIQPGLMAWQAASKSASKSS
jgi:hypothetical protein